MVYRKSGILGAARAINERNSEIRSAALSTIDNLRIKSINIPPFLLRDTHSEGGCHRHRDINRDSGLHKKKITVTILQIRLPTYDSSFNSHVTFVSSPHWKTRLTRSLLALVALYLLLLIPDTSPVPPKHAVRKPFIWNQDQRWEALEARFSTARKEGCSALRDWLNSALSKCLNLVKTLRSTPLSVDDTLFSTIEETVFSTAPSVGVCPDELPEYLIAVISLREAVKEQSVRWEMKSLNTRNRMYRLLYGSRAATEEVMLQVPAGSFAASVPCYDEPSQTPYDTILGVKIHSGDILVSRGGAPTSALIARGNDYPGNFSHVALVYVDSLTRRISLIESHIEKGVAIASPEDYLRDTKLRIMVLRLRSDLPPLVKDPMLPHRAASIALRDAQSRHIPYDFAMDFADHSKLFCSEVASAPYQQTGITLWMGISTISAAGVSSWLSAFGVQHFETQEPSDLEYDPQLRVVAEWRDPDALYNDHVDNAVIDAMLEGADEGRRLDHAWFLLPLARAMKAYSVVLNWFGAIGPVPEGMSATAALKHRRFAERHAAIKTHVLERAEQSRIEKGYLPPYWELLKFAREAELRSR
jgi:hypothetical protein